MDEIKRVLNKLKAGVANTLPFFTLYTFYQKSLRACFKNNELYRLRKPKLWEKTIKMTRQILDSLRTNCPYKMQTLTLEDMHIYLSFKEKTIFVC